MPTVEARPAGLAEAASFGALMNQALAAQTATQYREAEQLYRAALALNPRSFDALHMLGVVCLQQGNAEEGARLLMTALPYQPKDYPPFFQNLGLCLAAIAAERGLIRRVADADREGEAYRVFFRRHNLPPTPIDAPLVSIVVPCYNHESFVEEAIASISRQTYPNIELIVIDDGSKDGSVAAISRALADCQYPHQFVHRENKGAHASINEGIEMASGKYIGILNTDDLYTAERVEFMVRMLAGTGARWGFSSVAYIDETTTPIPYGVHPYVDTMMKYHDVLYRSLSVSEDFPTHNHAISTGNLFFERQLWQEIGGFEALRYNHDWAFCLAAILIAEPAYFDQPTYLYRLHGSNTIGENREVVRREADSMLSRWHHRLASTSDFPNRTFAQGMGNYRQPDFATMANGAGHLLDRATLLRYARELCVGQPETTVS